MVTPSYHPIIGGTETNVRNLSIKLNELGVTTDILTFNMNKQWKPLWRNKEEVDGVKIMKIPALNVLSKIPINPLRRLLRVNVIPDLRFIKRLSNYDIIHFHDEEDLSFPLFSFLTKKPKIFHVRTLPSNFGFYKKNSLSRLVLRSVADFYISQTNYNRDLLVNLGISIKRITVLPNGIDTQKFKPNTNKKINNLILFVGRLGREKGLHVLLNSLKCIDIPVRLVIIGPKADYKYFERIMKLIRKQEEKGIHKIEYLGSLEHNKLVEWYQKASVFACPSFMESFPTANLEALSCETPVVASKIGGIPEQVKDKVNGILVPPNNSEKLAYALKRLLTDKQLRETYGKEGRRTVKHFFSSDQVIKKLIKIYEMMC